MANDLKEREQQDSKYNTAQDGWDDIINNNYSPEELKKLEEQASEMKKPGQDDSNLIPHTPALADAIRGKFWTRKRKGITGGIVGALITLIVFAGSIGPFGMFIHAKEVLTKWNTHESAKSQRLVGLFQKRYFKDPAACTGAKVVCRLSGPPKLSAKEVDALRRAGLNPTMAPGDRYVVTFTLDDGTKIDGDNFKEQYKTNPDVRAAMDKVHKPRAFSWRGSATLKRIGPLLNRKAPLGDTNERDKMAQEQRKAVATAASGGTVGQAVAGEDDSDDHKKRSTVQVEGAQGAIDAEAERIKQAMGPDLANPAPADNITDANDLDDVKKASLVASNAFKKGLTGSLMGWASSIDSYCTFKMVSNGAEISAKLYQHRALIAYAGIFLTMADAAKAGEITPAQASFVGFLMTQASTHPGSAGKKFFDAEGMTLVTQGKVGSRKGLARYTNGTPALRALEALNDKLSIRGVGTKGCKQVKSWYGQALLIGGGIVSSIVTLGSGAIKGATEGVIVGAAVGLTLAYTVPKLARLAAGAVAPDINDPEGSYGRGNAVVAGVGAMNSEIGRGGGLRPLTKDEVSLIARESSDEMNRIAMADSINSGGSNFSLDNPNSVAARMAVTITPLLSSINGKDILGSLMGTIQVPQLATAQVGSALNGSVYAQGDEDRFGGEHCQDEDYTELNLATDAFCNPIYGESSAVLGIDSEEVASQMVNWGYVDGETGEALGEYKKFLEVCPDGAEPISTDSDTKMCMDKGQPYRYFRLYRQDEGLLQDLDDNAAGKLGAGSQTVAPADGTTSPDTPTGPIGDVDISAFTKGPDRNGYYQLGEAPNGEFVRNGGSPPSESCGTKQAIGFAYTIATAWALKHPDEKLKIGDLNSPGRSVDHKNGIDVDFYTVKSQQGARTPGAFTSAERAIELGKMMIDTKQIDIIRYQDPTVVKALREYANNPSIIDDRTSGHYDHFHVKISQQYAGPTSTSCAL